MKIYLKDIFPIDNTEDFKIHFAQWNGYGQPLDDYVSNPKAGLKAWNEWYPGRNDFNRPYIFCLVQFYHEADSWLFGGIFKVVKLHDEPRRYYEVELTDNGEKFIGRLKLGLPKKDRNPRPKLGTYYEQFEVKEILAEPYSGRYFPGYEDIDLSFAELENLVKNDKHDWKAALENVKGVYLLADVKSGQKYVGSAYGEEGIWARWRNYVYSGHGGNVGIYEVIKEHGFDLEYCRSNFRFALLEYRSFNTPDDKIISRENYWKEILLTRKTGMNRN